MRKYLLIFFLILVLIFTALLAGAGYFVGDYFVNFTLKRGNDMNPHGPPQAYSTILGVKKAPEVDKPNYVSEDWQMTSQDGLKLQATYFEPRKSSNHRWVILVHGYGGNQTYVWNLAKAYLHNGYQVLTPDLRAAGKSEGKYITLGILESKDIIDWSKSVIKKDPSAQIVLHGVSMGAATVMLAEGGKLPTNIKAVVEDCGYTSAYQMLQMELVKVIKVIPPEPILWVANLMTKVRTGVYFSDATPIKAVQYANLPTLFIHGNTDDLVPFAMMQQLFDSSTSTDKEELTVENATHAMSYVVNPRQYFGTVFNFLNKHLS